MFTYATAHADLTSGFTSIVIAYILPSTYFAVVPWFVVYTICMDSFRGTCWILTFLAICLDLGVTAYTSTIAINAKVYFTLMAAV